MHFHSKHLEGFVKKYLRCKMLLKVLLLLMFSCSLNYKYKYLRQILFSRDELKNSVKNLVEEDVFRGINYSMFPADLA